MKHILIVGDSFSCAHLASDQGWPRLLEKDYITVNLSQPGVGEYKILQQIKTQDVSSYDAVIVSHTSPYRLHCVTNPLYPQEHLYHASDIIMADAESKLGTHPWFRAYVDQVYDPEYFRWVHDQCCREIEREAGDRAVHLTHFDWEGLYRPSGFTNFNQTWQRHRGDINHYDADGNAQVYETVKSLLQKLFKNKPL